MEAGISFDEACEKTPYALTGEQLENCPGREKTLTNDYVSMASIALVVLVAVAVITVVFMRKKKHSAKK